MGGEVKSERGTSGEKVSSGAPAIFSATLKPVKDRSHRGGTRSIDSHDPEEERMTGEHLLQTWMAG